MIHTGANSISINRANDNIFISYSLPYLIEIYSGDGSLVRRFGRKTTFFGEIRFNRYGTPTSCGSSLRITCLPDGKIVNVIRRSIKLPNNQYEYRSYLDFFDKDGIYLITVSAKEFGIQSQSDLTEFTSDSQGNIWMNFDYPYPHITKFKMEFRAIKD
jgi:hypothetical protein